MAIAPQFCLVLFVSACALTHPTTPLAQPERLPDVGRDSPAERLGRLPTIASVPTRPSGVFIVSPHEGLLEPRFALDEAWRDSEETDPSYVTAEERNEELGEHAWRIGDFKIVPTGAFWADMVYATSRTSPGAYTLFVVSEEENGEDAFTVDARRSRFGLDVTGPAALLAGDALSGGKVEVDFHGNFVTENRASIQLRHAYWEEKNSDYRLLVGQTWDVISPLNPGMLDAGIGLSGGNIGYRRTQFRAERYFSYSDTLMLTLQGSLNQNIVADFPTDPGVRREPSDWPLVQGRAALTLGHREEDCQRLVIGVSGHVGEVGFDFLAPGPPPLNLPPLKDARFETWSFNVDLVAPLGPFWGVQGEFFTGADLSAFLGGIGQGVCPCLRVPIRSTGGWLEVWSDWPPRWHIHAGAGVDDPVDDDLLLGRSYNQFVFTNVSYDITDRLTTGVEVAYWKTLYQEVRAGQIPDEDLAPSEPGRAVVIDWMMKYGF
jgi:hypothetical protein